MLVEIIGAKIEERHRSSYKSIVSRDLNLSILNKNLSEVEFSSNNLKLAKLIFIFLPSNVTEIKSPYFSVEKLKELTFKNVNIEYKFLKYIIENSSIIFNRQSSNVSLNQIKEAVVKIL